jgi:hypothetical protein
MDEGPGLILGPKRVARDVWPDEARKWEELAGIEVEPILGTPTQRYAALGRDRPWFSINYENVPWLVEHLKGKKPWPFRTIVADESTRLKGARAMGQGGQAHQCARQGRLPAAGQALHRADRNARPQRP